MIEAISDRERSLQPCGAPCRCFFHLFSFFPFFFRRRRRRQRVKRRRVSKSIKAGKRRKTKHSRVHCEAFFLSEGMRDEEEEADECFDLEAALAGDDDAADDDGTPKPTSSASTPTSLLDLPLDLHCLIFSALPADDLSAVGATCRALRRVVLGDEPLWRRLFWLRFGPAAAADAAADEDDEDDEDDDEDSDFDSEEEEEEEEERDSEEEEEEEKRDREEKEEEGLNGTRDREEEERRTTTTAILWTRTAPQTGDRGHDYKVGIPNKAHWG